MSASDEVRRMLDERGVEWRASSLLNPDKETRWSFARSEATFTEFEDGVTVMVISGVEWTPEQAIAATLGLGTCKQEEHGWSTEGDHARVWLTCGHDCMVETVADLPNFCPTCGAKVVDA